MKDFYWLGLSLENAMLRIELYKYEIINMEINVIEKIKFGEKDALESVINSFIAEKKNSLLISCLPGTIRYACRLINTIKNRIEDDITVILCTEELNNNTLFNICNQTFRVVNTINEVFDLNPDFIDEQEIRYISFSELPADYSGVYRTAMENGFILYHTGMYPAALGESGIKHIETTFDNVKEVIQHIVPELNSAIIINDQTFDSGLFETLMSIPGNLSHFHFIVKEGNVTFDDSGIETEFIFTTMADYVKHCCHVRLTDQTYMLSLNSHDDYNAMKRLLDDFCTNGRLGNPRFYIQNECKLMCKCNHSGYRRALVDGEFKVHVCNSTKLLSGTIYDSEKKRNARLSQIYNQVINCKAVGAEEQEDLLSISGNRLVLEEFLLKKNLLIFLYSRSGLLINAHNLIVPNRNFSVIYNDEKESSEKGNNQYLFIIDGVHFCFHQKRLALVKTDPKLFLILEADMKGADHENVIEALSRYCRVDHNAAKTLYEKGMDVLSRDGLIIDRYLDWIEKRRGNENGWSQFN